VLFEDGRILNGIITRESHAEIVLALDPHKTQSIQRSAISEIHSNPVSLMPQGFAKVLSLQELSDLGAFLRDAQR
jgi:putative heme-binding domain-containing protein